MSATLACEDQTTTLGWGIDSFLAPREVPVTDRAFSYDVNLGNVALLVTGDLGSLRGEGTASMIAGGLTSDKQAQLCTTGDLTWTVAVRPNALASPLGLPQHPDEHRPERPVLLAVDQELGEGAALRIAPELADPVGPLEVGEHQDVEQLGAGSGTEGVEAHPCRRRK